MRGSTRPLPTHINVAVIGAGLSGIGAGYRLQTECPELDYLILDARESVGGTWDLFRYPGIRSDFADFPKQSNRSPWRTRQNYLLDRAETLRPDFTATLVPTSRQNYRQPALRHV